MCSAAAIPDFWTQEKKKDVWLQACGANGLYVKGNLTWSFDAGKDMLFAEITKIQQDLSR